MGEHLDRPATQDEFTKVLGELLERQLVESAGPWKDEQAGETDYRFRSPGDPDFGEECYAPTKLGAKLARLCVGTAFPPFAFWVLGDQRLDDQVILSCWGQDYGFDLEASHLYCCCAPPDEVARAATRLIEAGLLEPDPNHESRFRLSYEAQERRSACRRR